MSIKIQRTFTTSGQYRPKMLVNTGSKWFSIRKNDVIFTAHNQKGEILEIIISRDEIIDAYKALQ